MPAEMLKGLPAEAKKLWEEVYEKNKEKHGEERAAKIAWGAVKRVWTKKSGKWVKRRMMGALRLVNSYDFTEANFSEMENGNTQVLGVIVCRAAVLHGRGEVLGESDMEDMVENFHELRRIKAFENVPVRIGHRGWDSVENAKNVVGYKTNMYLTDKKELAEDWEIVDEQALYDIKRGKYRATSIEIHEFYVNNDPVPYIPVNYGTGLVDIPAIQNLKSFKQLDADFFDGKVTEIVLGHNDELQSTLDLLDTYIESAVEDGQDVTKVEQLKTALQECQDDTEAQRLIQQANELTLRNQMKGESVMILKLGETEIKLEKQEDTTQVLEAFSKLESELEDSKKKLAEAETVKTEKEAAVKALTDRMEKLESILSEKANEDKKAYVESLVAEGKIFPAQKDSFTNLVLSCNDEQLTVLKSTYEAMPARVEVGKGVTPKKDEGDRTARDIEMCEEEIRYLSHSMNDEQIKATKAWKRLQELKGGSA